MTGPEGSDPGAVAFEAIAQARSDGVDVVIVDTAGRLHTQDDLMAELGKVRRVIARQLEGAPHETLLTLDATTGQNGLRQAKLFAEAAEVTGVVLTKLDGTARGGIALAIARELELPVKLIGVGESVEDLRPFDPEDFARALIAEASNLQGMDVWIIWLVAAGVLGVGEMHQGGFYLAPFALGRGARRRREPARRRAPLLSALVFLAASGIVFAHAAPGRPPPPPAAAVDPHRRGRADRAPRDRARADRQRRGRRLREDRRRGVDRAQL